MTIRDLVTNWGFKIEHEKLDKVENQLEAIKHRLDFLSAVEVMKGLYELTEKFAHFAEELHVAATSAGITVEAFQKLAFASKQSGISQDEMAGGMARLSRQLYQARLGGEHAQKAFAQAGFSQSQIAGFKTGQDVMMALADRMKGMTDPIQKQALAMQLMGRGSVNMVGFLSQGSAAIKGMGNEAERLGIVLGEKQVEALVKVEHGLQKLWGVAKGIAATFAAYLAPSVTFLIDQTLKYVEANRKLIQSEVEKWAHRTAFAMGFLYGLIKDVVVIVFGLGKRLIAFSEAHPHIMKVLEAIGLLIAGLFAANIAAKKFLQLFNGAKSMFGALKFVLTSPFSLMLLAIGGIIVAVHDLWNIFHGKPTWIKAFTDWLGISEDIEDVMFSIFQLIMDIGNFIQGLPKAALGILGSIGNAGVSGLKYLGEGAANVAQIITQPQFAPAGGAVGQAPGGGAGPGTVNAPVTINVPAGTDPKMVGQKIKEGIREHLDRVNRETQRSLRPAISY